MVRRRNCLADLARRLAALAIPAHEVKALRIGRGCENSETESSNSTDGDELVHVILSGATKPFPTTKDHAPTLDLTCLTCDLPISVPVQIAAPLYTSQVCVPPVSQPPRYLATKLAEPLPTTDGGVLRTIQDARHYMLGLPEHRAIANAWQYAAKLILNRAAATEVTRQLSLALFLDAALDIGARPARTRKSP